MANNDHKPDEGTDRVLHNIQAIKDGRLNPKSLSEHERQECVEFLSGEGYTQQQIGEVLTISDRTVRRDLEAIEERNALTPDLNLAKRIIGNMFRKAVGHHRYLVRLARTQGASVSEKIRQSHKLRQATTTSLPHFWRSHVQPDRWRKKC